MAFFRLAVFASLAAQLCMTPASAQVSHPSPDLTPAEAYAEGCGGCHTRERDVLNAIPRKAEAERRAWIERFMLSHPCEHDVLKPKIVEYLIAKTRR
ncbi:MAG: hypothetical protein LCH38_06075 [Proteobacteria bacterium]|nr:hypothetical protein [Pseudomonadota bacterium]